MYTSMRRQISLGLVAEIVTLCILAGVPSIAEAVTKDVYVDEYGRFIPMWTHVDDGDTVVWHFYDRDDSVIARDLPSGPWPSICTDTPRAYDETDPNEFTGPMPLGGSGIYVMGPKDAQAQSTTWESESISGVFLRLRWDKLDGGPDWAARLDWTAGQRYDWTVLDHEMDQAVANGKMFSLGIKAGRYGTPDWIFAAGVTPLRFNDDRTSTPVACGDTVWLGNPAEATYRDLYNEMLTAVGAHIRENNEWYRSLSYIKLCGANRDTHENMLPSSCQAGCICNPEVWANAGYTPEGLYDFYQEQAETILEAFPNKSMSYMLIQAGFPRVNEDGDYLGLAGPVDNDGDGVAELPSGIEQTWTIIRRLQDLPYVREKLVVQQNALTTGPDPLYVPTNYFPYTQGQCRYHGVHPVEGPAYDLAGVGCPNPWVLRSGWRTRNKANPWDSLTGFQTQNVAKGVATPADLEQTFQNAFDSSDAVFIEIYEGLFTYSESVNGGVLDALASGWTIADWNDEYNERRRIDWTTVELPDPKPLTHSHTFTRTQAGAGSEIRFYVHGQKCGVDDPTHLGTEIQYGVVVIDP